MSTRNRVITALVGTLCLVLAACGSRLDHETIIGAAAGGAGVAADGQNGAALGEDLGVSGGSGPGDVAGGSGSGEKGTAGGNRPGAGAQSDQPNGPGGSGGDGGRGQSGGPPLVIGTLGAYSGGTADLIGKGGRAVQAWAASINKAGGINGRQVKVILRDDGGDPGRAKAAIQQLVERDKVVAIVAAMETPETLHAWRGYAEDKGVPVIGGLCGIDGWDGSPVLFRQCQAQPTLVFGTAKIGAQYGKGKKLGGLFCTETDACTIVEKQLFDQGFAKKAGLDPRYRARISLFQTDFTSECIQARNNGVQLLWVSADAGGVSRVAASCHRQNYHPQFIEIAGSLNADSVTKPGLGDMVIGSAVFPFAGLSTPAAREFHAAWNRFGGGSGPNAAAADGWTAAKLFEKAAKSAGGDITRASLISALRGLKNERLGGLTVPLNFGAKGSVDVKCVFFMRGSGGKWATPNGDKPTCW
jgi:branched-chain amino acid transport system substrate-binding protein